MASAQICRLSENFQAIRNEYVNHLNQTKCAVISQKILDCKGNTSAIYKIVNNLTGNRENNLKPSCKLDRERAKELGAFFIEKLINKIGMISDMWRLKIRQKFKKCYELLQAIIKRCYADNNLWHEIENMRH